MLLNNPTSGDCIGTPAAIWRERGKSDPFGDTYDCSMDLLALGTINSRILASLLEDYSSENRSNPRSFIAQLSYIMSAKDRIRWLSRRLSEQESEQSREDHNIQRSHLPMGSIGDDAMAFTLAVDGNDRELGRDTCLAAVQRIKWLVEKLEKYNVQC